MKAFVVAISGIAGSGKSTLCRQVARRIPKTAVVSFEDHLGLQGLNSKWLSDGADFNSFDMTDLRNAVDSAAKKSKYDCVLLDYPLGRCNEQMNKVIDFAFFLDVPLDIALARRFARDLRIGTEKARSGLEIYMECGSIISRKLIENVPKTVDVKVNAQGDIDELAESLAAFINCLLRNCFLFTNKKSVAKRK